MPSDRRITFAVATHGTGDVLRSNFLASPCFRESADHEVLVQQDYGSASLAYNAAIDEAKNDLIVFVHQDMIFPQNWLSQVSRAIDELEGEDPEWGVLGCYGKRRDGWGVGYIYSPGRGVIGTPVTCATRVQTLDEIVLIIRRSSGLRFDDDLPHFHLYGTDICMRAARMGRKSYVIPAFCIHNAHQYVLLPKEFYECCDHVKRAWQDCLPIETTCVRITRFDSFVLKRRLREMYLRYIRQKGFIAPRATDIPGLLREAGAAVPGM